MVVGVNGTQETRGRNMQSNWFCDALAERVFGGQPRGTGLFMGVVDASFSAIVPEIVQEVPHVVEQRRHDFRSRPVLLLGQLGGLECMVELGDGFAAVGLHTQAFGVRVAAVTC